MSKLVIVESPKKAKTISGKLKTGFKVVSTKGHIKDLPKGRIGINVNDNFECDWVIVDGKQNLIRDLLQAAKSVEQVLLASDPDREGEAISYHVYEVLRKANPNIKRIVFNEITKSAIINAINNPRDIDYNLFESQKARRILDRLVGFLLSPLLMHFLKRKLSAGRVQSVALKIIVDQEKQILNFLPEEYWKILGIFIYNDKEFEFELRKIENKKLDIKNKAQANEVTQSIKKSHFTIKKVQRDKTLRNPPEPFKTSTLQQECNIRFGFSGKRTMKIAQDLYEGKTIDGSDTGLITYMRTDSVRVSNEAKETAQKYILEELGLKIGTGTAISGRNPQKIQDAHEAIRPSSPYMSPDKVGKFLTKDENKVYDLIWRRFIGSFLSKLIYNKLTVVLDGAKKFSFDASFLEMAEEGFTAVYKPLTMPKTVIKLPQFIEGNEIDLKEVVPKQYFTEPPKRWTEAGLIKALEKQGIGRPSTYATILDTLMKRNYIRLEKKTIFPLPVGVFVSDLLDMFFSSIINVHFTADMEDKLDHIEQGKKEWIDMIRDYYELLRKNVKIAKSQLEKGIITDVACPQCGSKMSVKFKANGEYLSCSNYPACKHKADLGFDDKFNIIIHQTTSSGKNCPDCDGVLIIKKGRYGNFYGCSKYPDCRYTEPLERKPMPGMTKEMLPSKSKVCQKCGSDMDLSGGPYSNYLLCKNNKCRAKYKIKTGIKCPSADCPGELVEKHKNSRPYYACSEYPACKVTVPYRPIQEKCPECGFSVMILSETKNRTAKKCASKECRHKEIVSVNK